MALAADAAAVPVSTDFFAAERINRRNTILLIVIVLLVGALVGWCAGWMLEVYDAGVPPQLDSPVAIAGAALFVAVGVIATLVTIFSGGRTMLAMTGAGEVDATQEPLLHNVVEEMAIAAGMPKPRVAVIESPALNAFATGMRVDKGWITVTRGLLKALNRDELQGVVAHEMGHIRNLDTRYMTSVAILVGLIALFADFALRIAWYAPRQRRREDRDQRGNPLAAVLLVVAVLALVLAPLFSKLVQMAVSRQREYLADATAVRLSRNPLGLVAALRKLYESKIPLESANRAVQHMFIVNPIQEFGADASDLMATHPAIDDRIARLLNLGGLSVGKSGGSSLASRAGRRA